METVTAHPRRKPGTSSIHITALDGIVNVNSLFTFAVFIGLAWNPSDPSNSLVDAAANASCVAAPAIAENLISFHVYSFSSFLFSSLVALCLKQAARIPRTSSRSHHFHIPWNRIHLFEHVDINKTALRVGTLISGVGSVFGCVFLMLALINLVQIKLGTLACGSSYSYAAVIPLVIFVPIGLVVYVCMILYAFTR